MSLIIILINYIISCISQLFVNFSGYPKKFYDNAVYNKL